MATRNPSRNSRPSGFIPLGGESNSNGDMEGIQLTKMKSNASTGHRKANMDASSIFGGNENGDEKKHHHHPHIGRRRRVDTGLTRQSTGEASLNAMGRLYNKIIGFSVITRYLVYVVPVGVLLAVPLIVLAVLNEHHDKDHPVGKSNSAKESGKGNDGPALFKIFLWVEIMWITCWVAKVVAWFLPAVFMFFCGVVSMGTRKYATVLQNLVLPFSFFFWALACFVTFNGLFKDAISQQVNWCKIMQRVLGALFVSTAVLLIEKIFIQIIGVSYHQRSFALRINASKREIHLLGLLFDASRTLFPMYSPEFAEEDYVISDTIESMLNGGKRGKRKHKRSGSATPMKIINDVGRVGGNVIGGVGRVGEKVTSVFGNLASEITGKQVFNPNSAHSIVLEALEKEKSSEALGRRIWMSFVEEDKHELYPDDFEEVLGPAYKTEAEEAFSAIDGDDNGDISLDEMTRKVIEIGVERRAIQEGMKNIGQALQAFDKILLFVVLLIVIFVFLAFFQSKFITTLTTAGTTLLSLSFVFAVTCQEILGSCIFLFVKHPYDVGDRVEINATQMVVEKISLLYTVLTRIDKNQVTQVPNIQLNNLWIDNVSRSKAMTESVELHVSYDTSFEDIELLRQEMENFVRAPENSRDFQPEFKVSCGGVGNLDMMVLYVSIKHKSNWHNDAVRANRRSRFMCALAVALKKVPIFAPGGGGEVLGGPTNPTYSVAVDDNFAAKSRDDAAKAANEKRMVPAVDKDDEQAEHDEMKAAHDLAAPASHWDVRDDKTLGSREGSEDRRISRSESLHTELKRESTRGRRKPGESIPNLTLAETRPSIALTQTSSHSPQHGPFDEEAETGMGTTPYHSNLSASGSAGPSNYQPYNPAGITGAGNVQTGVQNPLQGQSSQTKAPQGPQGPPRAPPPSGR